MLEEKHLKENNIRALKKKTLKEYIEASQEQVVEQNIEGNLVKGQLFK